MAYDPARGLLNGSALVGGLIEQGRRTQDYVDGMFDTAARRKAGAAIAKGDNQTAAGLLGARGDLEGAATLRKRASTQSSLQAIDAGNFDRAKEESAAAGDTGMYGAAQGAEDDDRKARIGWLGNASDALLQIKGATPEETAAKRGQAFKDHIAPTLKAMGMDDATIAQINGQSLTDEGLQTFKASIGGVGTLDVQKLDDGTVIGIDKKSGDVRVLHQGAAKGVVVGRDVVNPVTGALIYQGPVELGEGESLIAPGQSGGGASGFAANIDPLLKREGGFTASDGRSGAPANFGINQKYNPDIDVANLTAEGAKKLYKERYWDAANVDQVPPAAQAAVFDAAVNQGPERARQWWSQAGGDLGKFNELRLEHYRSRPDYAENRNSWERRVRETGGGAGSTVIAQGKEKPKRAYLQATPEELKAAGYPPGTRAQKDAETGKFENIKQPIEAEVKAAGYANRVLGATQRVNELFEQGIRKPKSPLTQMIQATDNGFYKIVAKNPADRRFVQAFEDWITPILRKDTGAAVTFSEFEKYANIYMPMWEDDDALLRQKARSRVDAVTSMIGDSNGVYEARYGKPKLRMLMPGEKPAKSNTVKAPSGKVVKIEVVGD